LRLLLRRLGLWQRVESYEHLCLMAPLVVDNALHEQYVQSQLVERIRKVNYSSKAFNLLPSPNAFPPTLGEEAYCHRHPRARLEDPARAAGTGSSTHRVPAGGGKVEEVGRRAKQLDDEFLARVAPRAAYRQA